MLIAKIFACAFLFFFVVIGMAVGVRYLSGLILGAERRHLLSVILLDGVATEYTLRCAIEVHSCALLCGGRIYAVDCGMNQENRRIAEDMAKKYPCISILDMEDFIRMTEDLDFPEYRIRK